LVDDGIRVMGSRALSPVQGALPFDDSTEIPNASDWCQRWRGRRHSFRHVSESGSDARRYAVEVLPETAAKEFVVGHHHSGSFPSARFRFGPYDLGAGEVELRGVAVFGVPVMAAVLTRPLPDLQPWHGAVDGGADRAGDPDVNRAIRPAAPRRC
jgi:hypothetical protein